MKTLNHLTIAAVVPTRNAVGRFWHDQRGASVSTVVLIAFLVIAIAAFGATVATKIGEAETTVQGVDFQGGN